MEEVRTVLATLIPIIPTYTVFIARLIHGGVNTLDVREGPQHESRLCWECSGPEHSSGVAAIATASLPTLAAFAAASLQTLANP